MMLLAAVLGLVIGYKLPDWGKAFVYLGGYHGRETRLTPPQRTRLRLRLSVLLALTFALAFRTGWNVANLGTLLVLTYFALLAIIDLEYRLILNALLYPAFVLVLLLHIAYGTSWQIVLLGTGFAFIIFYGTALLKPGQLGGGDVKLATLIGMLLGFPNVLWALLLGAGLGAGGALLRFGAGRSWSMTIPYGPFLCLGAALLLLL